ncbi:hypothetical protein ACIQYS_09600 [Psychrobacillus sp. NPDC096426]|uniref:hypothetical protein n=1 Tax=Psychrobacillus sp. NPDC096426 TaxID=3364491 RepID=UPI0038117780
MAYKIIGLGINLPMATEHFQVGDKTLTQHGIWKTVTEIKDQSVEYENSTEWMYDIYVEGKLYKSVINSPVTITYSLEVESE